MRNIQAKQLDMIFCSSDGESFEVNGADLLKLAMELHLKGRYIAAMDVIGNAHYRLFIRQPANNSEKYLD